MSDKKLSDDLDALANEIEQGFVQAGGWKACRYLLGKLVAELAAKPISFLEPEKTEACDPDDLASHPHYDRLGD